MTTIDKPFFIVKKLTPATKSSQKAEAHHLFEQFFLEQTGHQIVYSDLQRSPLGKPLPIHGVHFSISHSGHFFAAALSNHPVGIDILDLHLHSTTNKNRTKSTNPAFLRKVLARGETPISGNPLLNFSAKEAYLKKTGQGITGGLSQLDANTLLATGKVKNHSTSAYALFLAD